MKTTSMRAPVLQPGTVLYDIYVKFHLGQYATSQDRMRMKDLLFHIHYGLCDTSRADAEIARRRGERS